MKHKVNVLRHKVTCASCGKTERIEVERGKKIKSGWAYFGRLQVNTCQTDKWVWASKRYVNKGNEFLPHRETEILGEIYVRMTNKCYDPKVKPKFAEYWECPSCMRKAKEADRIEKQKK